MSECPCIVPNGFPDPYFTCNPSLENPQKRRLVQPHRLRPSASAKSPFSAEPSTTPASPPISPSPTARASSSTSPISAARKRWSSPGPPGGAAVSICQAGRNSTPSSTIKTSKSSPPRRTPEAKPPPENGLSIHQRSDGHLGRRKRPRRPPRRTRLGRDRKTNPQIHLRSRNRSRPI